MGTNISGRLEKWDESTQSYIEIDDKFAVTTNWTLKFPNLRRSRISKRRAKILDAVKSTWFDKDKIYFFDFQSYDVFGWLADCRNYACLPPLTTEWKELKPKRQLDADELSMWSSYDPYEDDNRFGYVLDFDTLINFDYSQLVEYRRKPNNAYRRLHVGDTVPKGCGDIRTYKNILGRSWMARVKYLKSLNTKGRMVFWFDS